MHTGDVRKSGDASLLATAATLLAAAAVVAALVVIARIGWFSRMLSDDYCTAARLERLGFFGSLAAWYSDWSGRVGYYAIKAAFEAPGRWTIPFTGALFALLLSAAATLLVRNTLGTTPRRALLAGAALAAAIVAGSPHPNHTVFWQTGAITYTLPMIILIVWGALLARPITTPRPFFAFTVSAAVFAVSGTLSETTLAIQLAAVLCAAVAVRRTSHIWSAFGALAGTLIAAVVLTSAPGNAVRAAYFPPRGSLVDAATDAVVGTAAFTLDELQTLAAVIAFAAGLLAASRAERGTSRGALAIALICGVVLPWTGVVPSLWALSGRLPERVLHPPHVLIMIACGALGAAAAVALRLSSAFRRNVTTTLAAAVLAIACAIAAYSMTFWIDPAAEGAATLDAIVRDLERAPDGAHVIVYGPDIVGDLSFAARDPKYLSNLCVADYFGLASVRTVPPDARARR